MADLFGRLDAADQTIASLTAELTMARSALSEADAKVARMTELLRPVWAAEERIKASIVRTHGGAGRYRRDGAEARRPLFAELDRLSEAHGRERNVRKEEVKYAKALEREVKRLTSELEYEMKRKRRKMT
jgi:hypothetical protein